MTIARNHTDTDCDECPDFGSQAEYALFLRSLDPERYEDCRDDARFDAWDGDEEWAEDFGYEGDDEWADCAESSDCVDPTIF